MADETNKVIWPGWETVRVIGRGSFGAVYEIERDVRGFTERCALKVISIPHDDNEIDNLRSEGLDAESITETFKSILQNCLSEYALMNRLNGNTNIVNCYDVNYVQHDDGIGWDLFIRMELLTPFLTAYPGQLSEETVLRCAEDMCRALEICESNNIVHRDIKPQNIFVSDRGDFKLGDFGIAKVMEGTNAGTLAGTYRYMAPEVAKGEAYGKSADIYSLGLVLYWMLNERRHPFLPLPPAKLSKSQEDEARARRLRGEPIPAPLNGSEELKRIVLKACAYRPEDRYRNAAEMLRDVEKLLRKQGEGPDAEETYYEAGISGSSDAAGSSRAERFEENKNPSGEAISKRSRGKPLVFSAIALILLAAVICAAFAAKNLRIRGTDSADGTADIEAGQLLEAADPETGIPDVQEEPVSTDVLSEEPQEPTDNIPVSDTEAAASKESDVAAVEQEETYTDSFKNASISATGNVVSASLITPGIDDQYLVDQEKAEMYDGEYIWEIVFTDGNNTYSLGTRSFKYSDHPHFKTINNMEHILYIEERESGGLASNAIIAQAGLTVANNTLTWMVMIPEEYAFDPSNIRIMEYRILIPEKNTYIIKSR